MQTMEMDFFLTLIKQKDEMNKKTNGSFQWLKFSSDHFLKERRYMGSNWNSHKKSINQIPYETDSNV